MHLPGHTTTCARRCVQNGAHVPLLGVIVYGITQSFLVTTTFTLKAFQENYYYWNGAYFHIPEGVPSAMNYLRQFSHYTDTGHIISTLCLIDPTWTPVAFNTHFTISFAYWVSRILLGLSDDDDGDFASLPEEERPWPEWTSWWWALNHSVPPLVIGWTIASSPADAVPVFDTHSLLASFGWLYAWALLIYVPWRTITHDAVYSVLRAGTPVWKIVSIIGIVHGVLFLGNIVGGFLVPPFHTPPLK